MSEIFTSPKTLGEVLKHEYSRETCREVVTLGASASDYEIGTVLGRKADGTYVRVIPEAIQAVEAGEGVEAVEASTGEDVACAVLIEKKAASETSIPDAVVIARGPAIVADAGLEWDASINTNALKKQKHEQLAALGIAVREAV